MPHQQFIYTSNDPAVIITDFDGDGCEDAGEDKDDDNDTVPDAQDTECPKTPFGSADYDGDGCEDSKDTDDDDDGVNDFVSGIQKDQCLKGSLFTSISTSNDPAVTITDFDGDGCEDAGEDKDDDNDTVNDARDRGMP